MSKILKDFLGDILENNYVQDFSRFSRGHIWEPILKMIMPWIIKDFSPDTFVKTNFWKFISRINKDVLDHSRGQIQLG